MSKRQPRKAACQQYEPLEHRRMLVFAAVPITTDLVEFQTELVETNATIAGNTLYVASRGASNNIEVNLALGYVRAFQNDQSYERTLAFDLHNSEITRVVIIGNEGHDKIQLRQFDFANLMPGRLWARADHFAGNDHVDEEFRRGRQIEVIANSVEEIDATAYWNDFHTVANKFEPKNLVRINGSEAADEIRMPSQNERLFGLPIIEVIGQGFEIRASNFDDAIVRGNGGRDFATLRGTSNDDLYVSTGSFAKLETQAWHIAFHEIEWAKVDLGAGNDTARLGPFATNRSFRQVGGELVGGGSRLTHIENINVNLLETTNDTLVADSSTTDLVFNRVRNNDIDLIDFSVAGQEYTWRFAGLDKFADFGTSLD